MTALLRHRTVRQITTLLTTQKAVSLTDSSRSKSPIFKEHPDATAQIGGTTTRVRAVEAIGEERERIWAGLTQCDPAYEEYRLRTDRRIPVVLLQPTDSSYEAGRS